MQREKPCTLTSATSFHVDKRKYVAMHAAKMHQIHIAMMQVVVRVAKTAEQGGQKCKALSQPMWEEDTPCSDNYLYKII